MKRIATIIMALIMVIGLVGVTVSPDVGAAAVDEIKTGVDATSTDPSAEVALETRVLTIINIMLYIVGILAVAMLIYGGIRYTTSGGKQESVASAKNTIMYSIIGLVVAILAWAIVNFVIGAFA